MAMWPEQGETPWDDKLKAYIDDSADGGVVDSIVAGDNVTVDATDPAHPVVSAVGGGGGAVDSVNGQTGAVVLDAEDVGAAEESHQHAGSGDSSVALGVFAAAVGDSSVALGEGAWAGDDASTSVGSYASGSLHSTALGQEANAGLSSTALGNNAGAYGNATAVGNNAEAYPYSTAVGLASTSASFGTALGDNANAADNSVALGNKASADAPNTAAITAHTLTLEPRTADLSGAPTQEAGSIQMYNAAGVLVSISVDANNNIVVTPV